MRFTGLDFEDVPFGAGFAEEEKLTGFARNKNAIVLGMALLCLVAALVILLTFIPQAVGKFEVISSVASAAESPAASSENASEGKAEQASTSSQENDSEPISGAVTTLYVHVVGQVKSPGVYELTEGSRVKSAIDAAGGFTKKADSSALNLAALVSDGEQIVVPKKGSSEATEQSVVASKAQTPNASAPTNVSSTGTGSGSTGPIDINHATAQELTALPGVGESTAAKIVADREANGPFSSPSDIQRVSGIGEKKFESISSMICAK